jgi:hypothetical protein
MNYRLDKKLVRWLLAPSKLPDAPPMWLVIFVCGFCYNAITGHWWVALPSLVVAIVLNIFKITQESVDRLIFPSLRKRKNK